MKLFSRKNAIWLSLTLLAVIAVAAGFFIPSEEGEQEFWWSQVYDP